MDAPMLVTPCIQKGVLWCSLSMRPSKPISLGVEFFVEIPVVEVCADFGVVHLVADAEVGGLGSHQPGLVVLPGLFGEVSYEHGVSPLPLW